MPFDGDEVAFRTVRPWQAEIEMLDKLAELLADPANWCKGSLKSHDRRCFYGALNYVDHGFSDFNSTDWTFRTVAATNIHDRVMKVLQPFRYFFGWPQDNAGMIYNDRYEHQDILTLIAAVRRSFECI